MEEKLSSVGKCLFCNKTFTKAGINRHLSTHLKEKTTGSEFDCSFLVKVELNKHWGSTPYFLSLWIDGNTPFKSLDLFLRQIWLECCGHLSTFIDPDLRKSGLYVSDIMYDYGDDEDDEGDEDEGDEDEDDEDDDDDDSIASYRGLDIFSEEFPGEIPMDVKVQRFFCKGKVLEYEYDFGSTTALTLTVVEEYAMKAKQDIVLLSRNEPTLIKCTICKKAAATQLCPYCCYEGIEAFCDKCAPKHVKKCKNFDVETSFPIVNSPRMGVCGYVGGTIDIERDRYKKS